MVLAAAWSEANWQQGQRTDPGEGFAPPISSVPEAWTAATFYVPEKKCNSSASLLTFLMSPDQSPDP